MAQQFEFEFSNKLKVEVQKFSDVLTIGFVERIRKLSEQDQLFALYEEIFDTETREKLAELPFAELGVFVQAWQKDSGVSLGESASSPN